MNVMELLKTAPGLDTEFPRTDEEWLEAHRQLLDAQASGDHKWAKAVEVFEKLHESYLACETPETMATAHRVWVSLLEALRIDTKDFTTNLHRWDKPEGWLSHLRLQQRQAPVDEPVKPTHPLDYRHEVTLGASLIALLAFRPGRPTGRCGFIRPRKAPARRGNGERKPACPECLAH